MPRFLVRFEMDVYDADEKLAIQTAKVIAAGAERNGFKAPGTWRAIDPVKGGPWTYEEED